MRYFPINVDVRNQPVVVIGGGRIAARKVASLVACEAKVTVISPEFCDDLQAMEGIERIQRPYREGDLAGARLAICATNDDRVNQAVYTEAEERSILCNVVDQPEHCSFTIPAVLTRGDLMITISTGGHGPALAGRLRQQLEQELSSALEIHLRLLAEFRQKVKASGLPLVKRSALLKAMAGEEITGLIEAEGEQGTREHLSMLLTEAVRQYARASVQE